jgi:hypothetical protein
MTAALKATLIVLGLLCATTHKIMFTTHDKSLVPTVADPARRYAATADDANRRAFFFLFALFCLWPACSALRAGEQTPFEVFKSLQGQWTISAGDKTLPFHMTYALGSNGSIVTEQFGKELSVFYSDKGNLLMTHFCNRGNQPRLRLKAGGAGRRYEFDMFDITNLKDPSDDHVHAIIYEIHDPQHIRLEIIWKKGDGEESEKYVLIKLL